MNTLTGKSSGIALLLVAALIAALFAWGTFPVGAQDADPTITLSPTSAMPGDRVQVTGENFTATGTDATPTNRVVAITLDTGTVRGGAGVPVSPDGSFVANIILNDDVTEGTRTVTATGQGTDTDTAELTVTVTPEIRSLTPDEVNNADGGTVAVVIFGFGAGAVEVTATDSEGEAIQVDATDSDNTVEITGVAGDTATGNIAIPADTPTGTVTVTATKDDAVAMKDLEVVAPTITLDPMSADNSMAVTVNVDGENFSGTNAIAVSAKYSGDDGAAIDIDPTDTADSDAGRNLEATPADGEFEGQEVVFPVGQMAGEIVITASYTDGTDTWEDMETFTLSSAPPAQVMGVNVVAGAGSIAVSWNQVEAVNRMSTAETPVLLEKRPAADGYLVAWKLVSETTWPPANMAEIDGGDQVYHLITGLTPGVPYMVRVTAMNDDTANGMASGISPGSVGTPAAIPDVPMAPGLVQNLSITPVSHTQLSVSWNAPASDGGSAVTGYSVEYREFGTGSWMPVTRTGSNVGQPISGLTGGIWYEVRVAAMNSEGTGNYVQGSAQTMATPETVVVPDRTPNDVDLSSYKAGAAVRIDIDADADAMIPGGEDIVVELPKFGLPSSISTSEVLIDSDGYVGNPSDVTVSGSKITIEVPAREATSSGSQRTSIPVGDYSIRIKQGAGVTNPVAAGDQTVKITDADATAEEHDVTIVHVVSLSAGSVTRGDDLTLTIKGFANGTASVSINGTQVGQTEVSGNVGEFAIDTSHSAVEAGQDNVVTVIDSTGDDGRGDGRTALSDSFTIKPKVAVDPDSTTPSKDVEISLSDWPANQRISSVKIGGIAATVPANTSTDGDGAATFDVMVPRNALTGTQTVEVTGGSTTATTTIGIDVLLLTVSPSEVVPGAQVTISGSGFAKNTAVDEDSFMIDGSSVDPGADATSTSAGNISITVTLPLDVGSGTKKVELAIGGRDGEGELTVPKPSISLDPATSVPGSTITVTGSAFAANERVEVSFAGAIEEVGRADGNGDVSVRLTIPSTAGVGSSNEVMVKTRPASGDAGVNISAKETHKTPGPGITVTAEARVGGHITISGTNFASFSQLTTVTVGGLNAMPSPAPETDKNGAFSFQARVPRIGAGSHTVTVRDNRNNSATESFEVVTTAVINTPEEVFGVLGDSLVSVWSLNNATKVWSAYFPGAPEGVSDLTGVSSGDIVWINVSEDVMFQGGMLTTGWNLISLE